MNDPFRRTYRTLTAADTAQMDAIKQKAAELLQVIDQCGTADAGRERALAKTKLEESVMWAVKAITA